MSIRNPALIKKYRLAFPWCEACAFLEGSWPVTDFETHHIESGTRRDDLLSNIINICPPHHRRATTHNLQYGGLESNSWNQKYLAIKTLKKEFDPKDHRWEIEIRLAVEEIKKLFHLQKQDAYWWFNGEEEKVKMRY